LNEKDEDLDDPEPEKKLQGRGQDVMVALDFSGLHERRCKGYDTPDAADSDYETWKPHADGRQRAVNNCFLGRQFTYTRRKQHSECFNGEDFEGVIVSASCDCTEADYECDVGWEMDRTNSASRSSMLTPQIRKRETVRSLENGMKVKVTDLSQEIVADLDSK